MFASRAIIVTATVTIHLATAKFTPSCSWWYLHDQVALTAGCDGPGASKLGVLSSLDLNQCIGVDPTANAMIWQAHETDVSHLGSGDAFKTHCANCGMQSSEIVMQCDCTSAVTGGTTSSSVNLGEPFSTSWKPAALAHWLMGWVLLTRPHILSQTIESIPTARAG
ncbi:hypothetical protein diail_12098 [Diaporthe ilicicola]|nr:hypothetical protein diail_12098 [Diaporthe ilicicola]